MELMSRELFFAEEWVLLDRGTITEEEALRRVQKRLPDERTREMARLCLAHWHEFNIEPKPGMRELVMQIKEAGCAVYLCSNASHRLRVFEKEIPGIEYFDGVLVSAEEKMLKPEPEIFRRLFEKFSILPEESFFIDDIQANIDGAAACGMKGYCFADGDVDVYKRQQLIWLFVGMAFAGAVVGLSWLLHGFPFDRNTDILLLFAAGVGISLLMVAIFFPLFYLTGEERSEVVLGISLLAAILIFMGLVSLINLYFGPEPAVWQVITSCLLYTSRCV